MPESTQPDGTAAPRLLDVLRETLRLIRDGKGAKDSVTILPQRLVAPLQAHLQQRRATDTGVLKLPNKKTLPRQRFFAGETALSEVKR